MVNSVDERDLSLLNRVKYDSDLITTYGDRVRVVNDITVTGLIFQTC